MPTDVATRMFKLVCLNPWECFPTTVSARFIHEHVTLNLAKASGRWKGVEKRLKKPIKPPTFKRQKEKEYNSAWTRFFVAHTRRRRWHWKLRKSVIFCTVCEEAKKVNGSTKGSRNFQRSALVEHQKSASPYQCHFHDSAAKTHSHCCYTCPRENIVSTSRSAESQHFKISWKSALQDQLKVHRSVDGKRRQRLQQV